MLSLPLVSRARILPPVGVVGLVLLLVVAPRPVDAQVRGAYLPVYHPAQAMVELLVVRAVLVVPDPAVRPFLLTDLRRAADTALAGTLNDADRRRVEWVRAQVGPEPDRGRYALTLSPEIGVTGASSAVPELLLAESDSSLAPSLRLRIGAEFGPASVQFEPHRVQRGRTFFGVAVARVASSWGSVEWGKVRRNWGPSGVSGLLVSPLYPPRSELGFSLGPRMLRFEYRAGPVSDGVSEETGDPVARWWALHRLTWRPSPSLSLALWETLLAPEPGGSDPARFSPLTPFSFPFQQGLPAKRNVTVGLDASWRPRAALGLEAQLLLDDFVLRNRDAEDNPYPSRFGYVVQLLGAAGANEAWRVYLASLSGLALSTFDPNESFVDNGRGLGRLRPDHYEVGALLSHALDTSGEASTLALPGVVEVGLKWRRQGIRHFTDPLPDLPFSPATPRYPAYSPEIEREVWALVLGIDLVAGPLSVQAGGQLQRRRFPTLGGDLEWGLEGAIEVHWRPGTWSWDGAVSR